MSILYYVVEAMFDTLQYERMQREIKVIPFP